MKILIIGAAGMIGQRILAEALSRGHEVTAIVRDPSRLNTEHERLHAVVGDIFNENKTCSRCKRRKPDFGGRFCGSNPR